MSAHVLDLELQLLLRPPAGSLVAVTSVPGLGYLTLRLLVPVP